MTVILIFVLMMPQIQLGPLGAQVDSVYQELQWDYAYLC
jgi:hypothetical protein